MDRSTEPDKALRLLHRRREWACTSAGGLIGLVAYVIVGVTFFQGLTGTVAVISVVPLFVLLALIPAGLTAVAVDTLRLRRLGPAVRESAAGSLLDAAAGGRPARNRAARLSPWLVAGCLVLAALAYLPRQADAAAYLAGAGHQDTFVPLSYSQICGKAGCSQVTDGILAGSGEDVTWPGRVTLGRAFTVRSPVWASGPGAELIPSESVAVGRVLLGLFFETIAAVMALAAAPRTRHGLARAAMRVIGRPGHGRPPPAEGAGRVIHE